MTSFLSNALGGNPFSTHVGSRIEQATDSTLASENWALNMEICDLVNETEDGPKDAIRAIKKRLQQNVGKNYTVVMYTLTVLETCVKNCKRFHVLACNKDFVQELVKMIGPKNDPPTAVQEKVLSLIQSWADAFSSQPDLSGVVSVYQDLKAKGIEFPPTDLDSLAPIITPQRTVETDAAITVAEPHPSPNQPHISSPTSAVGGTLTVEQRMKLQSELDVVQSNMLVLNEMLSEIKPGHAQTDEIELLQELNVTCRSMQERLVELISKLSNDELTADLLRINDDLNNLFLRYSRWEKNREAGNNQVGQQLQQQSASAVLAKALGGRPQQKPSVEEDSLIDLGPPDDDNDATDDITDRLSKMSATAAAGPSATAQLAQIGSVTARNGGLPMHGAGDDEFDMFAQSRTASYEKSKLEGSTYKDNSEPQADIGLSAATKKKQVSSSGKPTEFDEMAAWLGQTTGAAGEESVTSSEFEKFLAERAAAAEALPTIGDDRTSGQPSNKSTNKKNDEKEGLLAL